MTLIDVIARTPAPILFPLHRGLARPLGMLAALLLGVALLTPTARAQNQPVVAEPELVDFGDVAPGESVTRTVTLRNTGHMPVHIRDVRASCECTTAKVPMETEILPNESYDVAMTFTGKTREGPQQTSVVVVFAERITPLRIEGKANVNRGIRFEVRKALGSDGTPVSIARLSGAHDQSFRVLSVNAKPVRPTDADEDPGADAPVHEVRIDRSGIGPGDFPGADRWVVILTNDPGCPVVVIPAPGSDADSGPRSWTIDEPLHVFGYLQPSEDQDVTLLLTGVRGNPMDALQRIDTSTLDADAGLIGIETAPSGMNARVYFRPRFEATGLVAAAVAITAQGGHTETAYFYGVASPVVP